MNMTYLNIQKVVIHWELQRGAGRQCHSLTQTDVTIIPARERIKEMTMHLLSRLCSLYLQHLMCIVKWNLTPMSISAIKMSALQRVYCMSYECVSHFIHAWAHSFKKVLQKTGRIPRIKQISE